MVVSNVFACMTVSVNFTNNQDDAFVSSVADHDNNDHQSTPHCEDHCGAYQCHSNALLPTILTHFPRSTNSFSTSSINIAFNSLHYPPAVPPPNA
jgi:hypothetical protein